MRRHSHNLTPVHIGVQVAVGDVGKIGEYYITITIAQIVPLSFQAAIAHKPRQVR